MKNLQDKYLAKMLFVIRRPQEQQREKLLQIFFENFDLDKNKICADIGGRSVGFDKIKNFCTAIIVNLKVPEKVPGWAIIIADARYLPFRENSIDIAISNSMLEHIENNLKKAVEQIKRISKGNFFISVPYLYTPFEPHYLVPFFQFVPEWMKKMLVVNLKIRIGFIAGSNYAAIPLFSTSRLQNFFPDAQIEKVKLYSLPVSLVAIGKNPKKAK